MKTVLTIGKKERMKKVYIAGAISSNKLEKSMSNIRKGLQMGKELLENGFAPFIPHLDFTLNLVDDSHIPVEWFYFYDLEWLAVCDCMLVLPKYEESIGVQQEIKFAKEHHIPIYYSKFDLFKDTFKRVEGEEI